MQAEPGGRAELESWHTSEFITREGADFTSAQAHLNTSSLLPRSVGSFWRVDSYTNVF